VVDWAILLSEFGTIGEISQSVVQWAILLSDFGIVGDIIDSEW